MRRFLAALGASLLVSPALVAQTPSAQPAGASARANPLPIRRVVLYKTGVGYFEHLGRVRGAEAVTITFTSAQLDDVLSSLTTLDLGGGRIASVSYNSDAPLAQRLGALRLPLGNETTLAEFFGALRGARLDVRSDGAVVASGRLLSVETRTVGRGDQATEREELSIVSDAGEVRTVELTPRVSVRMADRDLNEQVNRYLTALASARAEDTRRMVITTAGTGERQLFVSYVSEVPVWKTTYRIVMPSKPDGKPLLQGWAIVDNTIGEDWDHVELSLVAGAPQSFVQAISQPYYTERPVVPLPETARLTPQTHGAGLRGSGGAIAGFARDPNGAALPGVSVRAIGPEGAVVAQTVTGADGRYDLEGVPAGRYVVEFALSGFSTLRVQGVEVSGGVASGVNGTMRVGTVSETVAVAADATGRPQFRREAGVAGGIPGGVVGAVAGGVPAAPPPPPMAAPVASPLEIAKRMAEVEPAAQARDLGDLFEYTLKEPVTIRKNQSAMVPIANTPIEVERVSLWGARSGIAQPLRALWITNSSPLTLDAGSVTVIDDQAFAGEGLIEAIQPGARRLLSYAADLAVRVNASHQNERQRVTRVLVRNGSLTQFSEEREKRTYTIRNDDDQARTLVIEHPLRSGWTLMKGGPSPAETSADAYRFRVQVAPRSTATLVVDEARPREARYQVGALSDEQVALFVQQGSINPEVERALRPILEKQAEIGRLTGQIGAKEAEMSRIGDDQQRIRENMKVLKGSSEEKALLQRYTRQLDAQEDRLETLRKDRDTLDTERRARQAELAALIDALAVDVTLT